MHSLKKKKKKKQVNWKNSSLLTWTTMRIQIWIPPLILGCEWLFCQRLSPMVRGQPIWAHTTPQTNTQWHHIFLLSLYHKKSIACLPQRGRSEKCICVPFFFLVTFHVLVYLRTGLQHAPFLVSDMLADVCMFWFFDASYCLNEREDDENVRQ